MSEQNVIENETMAPVEEKKLYIRRPWAGQVREPEIPHEWRTYALSMQNGDVIVLDETWTPNEQTGEIEKVKDSLDNHNHFPTMTYTETEKLFVEAETSGESIPMTFAKLYGRAKLTIDQIGNLVHLRQQYAVPETMQMKRKKARRKEQEADMIKAAGIDIPSIVGKDTPAEVEARFERAALVKGGIKKGDLPAEVRIRGKAIPKLGEPGIGDTQTI